MNITEQDLSDIRHIADNVNGVNIWAYTSFYMVKLAGRIHTSKSVNYLKRLVRDRNQADKIVESCHKKIATDDSRV